MKQISQAKIERKRSEWVARTAAALAVDEATALALLTAKRRQSVRLNPLKGDTGRTLQELEAAGWRGKQYGWMPFGYTIDGPVEVIRDSQPVTEGRAYIQNAASWLPVLALDPKPCSGEGEKDITDDSVVATQWSVAQIKRLQQTQKRITTQAWQLLKPGGTLVYSTCTLAPEENEAVVDYLLRTRDDARIIPLAMDLPNRVSPVQKWNNKLYDPAVAGCLRLSPSEQIEAFFVCRLEKVVL